jgi:Tfp pilus assembly protein PilF
MSFFKRLLGGDFDSNRAEGDEQFAAERWGDAKLAYERALGKGKSAPEDARSGIAARIVECRRKLAAVLAERGEGALAAGELEAAVEAFEGAVDVAPEAADKERYRKLIDRLHAADARAAAENPGDASEDDRYEVLSADWDDEQLDEYESYGDAFKGAYLAIHEAPDIEQVGKALEALQALCAEHADDACYLHLEIGRALLRLGRREEGAGALRKLLAALPEGEGDRARIHSHVALAEVAMEANDDAGAEKELRAAAEVAPDLTAGHLRLGQFLRLRGRHPEAGEALEAAARTMGELRPDVRVLREIGLNQAALGDEETALETLEGIVQLQAAQDNLDLDPATAIALAGLHEKRGDPERAADFYRHLAKGSDVAHHFEYHREAARLLRAHGKEALAREHLVKAREIAPDDAARTAVDELLAAK